MDIEPSVVMFRYKDKQEIPVNISNLTTRTVIVNPREILCELHPVSIIDTPHTCSIQPEEIAHLKDVKIPYDELDFVQQQKVMTLLKEYQDIFSKGETDIGFNDLVKHRIELIDETPFQQRTRRIPPAMFEEIRNHLQMLLDANIIRKSSSPFSSNVVIVRKKDNKLRMCIDYRQLNQRTKKDAYALPRIEEILNALSGNKYFSILDMKSGYHQVELLEEHKERTAFTVGPLGFYEFNRLPFGLSNSPATYQRLMESCLGDLHLNICFIFLDDLIIFSKSYDEHMHRLQLVFDKLRESGLKLSPKKCNLFMKKVKYVGHIVSEAGIETDPDKVQKVIDWPTPTTPEEIRKFVGFIGYYRRFIPNFSKISKPLTEMMPKVSSAKDKKNKQKKKEFRWDKEQQDAFENLKKLLTTPPILGFADYELPFELHTDASKLGLGAVLYQEQHGYKRVISYASRTLSPTEKNYPAHKLEFLALKWAITEKFNDYLYGHQFTVLTDNNPLTYVLTTARLDAAGHRWLAALSAYDFNIIYRPGKQNQDADSLSRIPEINNDFQSICRDSFQAVCQAVHAESLITSLSLDSRIIDQNLPDLKIINQEIDWQQEQSADPTLKTWIHYVKCKQKPRLEDLAFGYDSLTLVRNFSKLHLVKNVLYREATISEKEINQLVIPRKYKDKVLTELHDKFGHPGRERTASLIKDRFYWIGMNQDIDNWIKNCNRCVHRKSTNQKAPLVNITSTYPLELVCIDFLTLEESKGGYQHVLVMTDHYTRFAQAIPTKNMTAKTNAEALFNNFINYYGIPTRIHSDQGANFESQIIKELCLITGMRKSRTTSYHAMGNGQCERYNRTLLNMLGTLKPEQKQNWKLHINPLVHAYNCTRNESTGVSPYFLMFGRNPRLAIDEEFGLQKTEWKSTSKYINNLKENMKSAYELVTRNMKKSLEKQKEGYDQRVRGSEIRAGDRVLVKIVSFDGKHKISDKWEEEPYLVLDQPETSIPVFQIQKETSKGKIRTLHRNLLLPIGHLESYKTVEELDTEILKLKPKPKPRTRNRVRNIRDTQNDTLKSTDSEEESSSDDEIEMVPLQRVPTRYITHDVLEKEDVDVHRYNENMEIIQHHDADDIAERAEELAQIPQQQQQPQDAAAERENSIIEEEEERPLPRRSTREKRKPNWMKEYVLTQQHTSTQDWVKKCEFLHNLKECQEMKKYESEIVKTMLDVLKNT